MTSWRRSDRISHVLLTSPGAGITGQSDLHKTTLLDRTSFLLQMFTCSLANPGIPAPLAHVIFVGEGSAVNWKPHAEQPQAVGEPALCTVFIYIYSGFSTVSTTNHTARIFVTRASSRASSPPSPARRHRQNLSHPIGYLSMAAAHPRALYRRYTTHCAVHVTS